MPGRSADDRSPCADEAAAGVADRLSLTVSVMLIGGLLLASAAIHQNARIDRPEPAKPLPPPAAVRTPANPGAAVIRLPPPPAPSRLAAIKRPATAQPPKPAPRVVKKTRPVEPLKRTAAVKPTAAPPKPQRPGPVPRIKPLEPAKPAALAAPAVTPPAPRPEAAEVVLDGTRQTGSGGALLRLLEHGQGPTIEIAWPQRADARRALYRQLTRCYGVRAAVLAGGTRLYADAGGAGEPWSIDLDRFSGFIRSPQGEAIAEEARVFAHIADRHGLRDWRPVRVFPRDVDAALLGGLGALLGPQYKTAGQIHAAYRWDPARLVLSDFAVDGRPLSGSVALPLPHNPGCD